MPMNPDDPWWEESGGHEHEHERGHGAHGFSAGAAPGAAAEEAGRLFAAMRDRLLSDPNVMRAGMQALEMFTALRGSVSNPVPPGEAPECAYCPICQAISRAQNLNPESVEVVTAAAMQFAESVREVLGESEPGQSEPTVRHVPMDDEPEPDEPEPDEPESSEAGDVKEDT